MNRPVIRAARGVLRYSTGGGGTCGALLRRRGAARCTCGGAAGRSLRLRRTGTCPGAASAHAQWKEGYGEGRVEASDAGRHLVGVRCWLKGAGMAGSCVVGETVGKE